LDFIRVVVMRQLPDTEQNAILHLLSALPEKVKYGVSHYQQHSTEMSTLLNRLFQGYQQEGIAMPYTIEDLKREYMEDCFEELTPELTPEARQKLFEKLTPREKQKLLKRPPSQMRQILIATMTPQEQEKLLEILPPQAQQKLLAKLTLQELLDGRSPEEIENYLRRCKNEAASPKRKKQK
jgi:Mg/Co/Ni transporter MgtE